MTRTSSPSSRHSSSSLLTNTLSRKTARLTSELLARYYLNHQEELEASQEWELSTTPASMNTSFATTATATAKKNEPVPIESKGRLGLRHLIHNEAERSSYQSSSLQASASAMKAFVSTASPAVTPAPFDLSLGNKPPSAMALLSSKVAPIDLRMERAFPRQKDVERFEAALRDAEKTIAERKRNQIEVELQQELVKSESKPLKETKETRGRPSKELKRLLEDSKGSLYFDMEEPIKSSSSKRRALAVREDSESDEESLVNVRLKKRISPSPSPLLIPPPTAAPQIGLESPTMSLRPRGFLSVESGGAISHSTASTIRSIDLTLAIPPASPSKSPTANQHMKIKQIVLGDELLNAWYHAPYPAEYVNEGNTLYICSVCLKYMPDAMTYERHKASRSEPNEVK